jgi:hypothetical protein
MLAAIVLGFSCCIAADDTPGGWPELFPQLRNFSRKVDAPTVEKGDKPAIYRQTTTYEWQGGRFEVITITLSRNPKHKESYAADAVKNWKPAAKELEINKKRAYLWDREKADERDKVNRSLIVVMADDKILVIEQRGSGLDLAEVAKKLDFDKVLKAMENPPPVKQK